MLDISTKYYAHLIQLKFLFSDELERCTGSFLKVTKHHLSKFKVVGCMHSVQVSGYESYYWSISLFHCLIHFFWCDKDFEIGSHILVGELHYILYTKSESFKVS
jgi:hypothetical protein